MLHRHRFLARLAAASSWLALLVLWLLDITRPGSVSTLLTQVWTLWTLGTTLVLLLYGLRAAWRRAREDQEQERSFVVLALLLVLAGVAHFAGVDHEAEGRYSGDERTYYGHALQINDGQVFRDSFIYPHLPYYGSALTLWLGERFEAPIHGTLRAVSGYDSRAATDWILLHLFTALFGALTVAPVFAMTRRLVSGPGALSLLAATAAGLLVVASSVYNEVTHLLLCDVPAAFFVTLCLYHVSRLLDEESTCQYLLAGLASGLAAASKYPAGLVALAIVVVWGVHRWRQRDLSLGLLWAGLVSLGSFLLCNPSLFVNSEAAMSGEKSLFFGPRLYARGGWIGIVKESNYSYYGGLLVDNFGWIALLLGAAGLLLCLARPGLRPLLHRVAILAVYPIVAFAVMVSVSVAVKRSLLPLLPFFAVVLGCGLGVLLWQLHSLLAKHGRRALASTVTAVLLATAVAPPGWTTGQQVLAFARQSTREQAVTWIHTHVPDGSRILREHYTPRPSRQRYDLQMSRFAARLSVAEIRRDYDYVVLSGNAFNRFLDPSRHTKAHHATYQRRYERMFAEFEKVAEFKTGPSRYGPHVVIYRVTGPKTERTPP